MYRLSKYNSELLGSKELISESLHRLIHSNIMLYARGSPTKVYEHIYNKSKISNIMKHYEHNLNLVFQKYKNKTYSKFESVIYKTNGCMTIKG